jgi:hypothetical protein
LLKERDGDADAVLEMLLGNVVEDAISPAAAPSPSASATPPAVEERRGEWDRAEAARKAAEQAEQATAQRKAEQAEQATAQRKAEQAEQAAARAAQEADEDAELAAALAASVEDLRPEELPVGFNEFQDSGGSSSSGVQVPEWKGTEEDVEEVVPTGWTVINAKPEPTQVSSNFVQQPDAPAWQPLLRSGGKDLSSAKRTFYDAQTDRLKAALAAAPKPPDALGPSATDMHGAGKGSGKASRGGG